ncbi:MAG: hypothetical protein CL843_06570 [Crocinitomicaceae bacterium]|nr:hypothetical protein [Crocinitomicaceae bacterium]|tara:strand:- start:6778 stop:7362 length:585 start_codon:yes stop_codon:yes gene_type:complete
MTKTYRVTREEERIFMFIDLKSSTSIAEQLGHVRYSHFLNTSFNFLSEMIADYQAEIYQFVGDEVVLTWLIDIGKKDEQCIKLFYNFKNTLSLRQDIYQKKFGIIPEFRASVHSGIVSVSESKEPNRELLYHGDVLNTCSRILELCNRYNTELMVSDIVAIWLQSSLEYTVQYINKFILRGKKHYTDIFIISQV